jgi:hypothetical protein
MSTRSFDYESFEVSS